METSLVGPTTAQLLLKKTAKTLTPSQVEKPKQLGQPQKVQKISPLREFQRPTAAMLRFTPYAWAKLIWFRDHGDTEIGGFGISNAKDLLLIEDFVTVQQDVGMAHVHFDDTAVADFVDSQVDQGHKIEQFLRLWCHTHPGVSPQPSGTDEATFARVFGKCDWAVMFILACDGKPYARLRFNTGPGGEMSIPVEVDYHHPFKASEQDQWLQEYEQNIKEALPIGVTHAELRDLVGWPESVPFEGSSAEIEKTLAEEGYFYDEESGTFL